MAVRRASSLFALLAIFALSLGYGSEIVRAVEAEVEAPPQPGQEDYELYRLFVDTLEQVERNYVKPVSRRELIEAAIRGVLSKLDQHTSYISPDDLGRFRTSVENRFGGIGIQIEFDRGQLRVLSPLVGTPAYRAGIHAGDRIVAIDGVNTNEMKDVDEAVSKMKGEPGTTVEVTVVHVGSPERVTMKLTREVIQIETVLGDSRKSDDHWDYMLDHERHIGYIRLTAFSRDTSRDLQKALDELKDQGLQGLIIDLRFNPGGLLTSAIEISDLFVSEGRIVSTEGRNSPSRTWDAQKEGTYEGFPMAVLVNRFSASASEILSACLQDHNRAVIVGERSFGKGSVQNVVELEGGRSALKLTTANYLRPSGKNIHRFPDATEKDDWGVRPNEGFEVLLDDGELVAMLNYRHSRDILQDHSADNQQAAAPATEGTPDAPADAPAPSEDAPEATPSDAGNAPAAESAPSTDKPSDDATPKEGETRAAEKLTADKAFVDRQLQKAVEYLISQMEAK